MPQINDPGVDENLTQLEKDVRHLKIEYEQYFGGGKARPPVDIEWRIESMLKRYGDRGGHMNYTQRFRFSNLAQTYSKYKEMFRKRLKQKEEGSVPRHFGAAAREIERERAAKRRANLRNSSPAQRAFAISCDGGAQQSEVQRLFDAFRDAKKQIGENTDSLTMEAFEKFVSQKTEQLKIQKGAHEVEYLVIVEGEHARLKARVKS